VRPETLRLVVRAYRVMAFTTGVLVIVLCFVGIPLQVFAHNLFIVKYVGTLHGFLYIGYVLIAFAMTRAAGVPLASWRTVVVLLAGTVPVLTFVVERWVSAAYIDPALAAAGVAPREHPVLR